MDIEASLSAALRAPRIAIHPREALLRGLSPERFFLLMAPFIFAAYALLTPPFQTFDENQHLYRAWQLASFNLRGERRGVQSGAELPPGLGTATLKEIGSVIPQGERAVVVRPLSEIFSRNTVIGQNRPAVYYDFFGAMFYSPISYLPQIAAIWVGEATGMSVEWTVRLGRLLNCALCLGLIWWALRVLPLGRTIMATVALLPPTAAGAASCGQDGLVVGVGFLLTAFGLHIAVEQRWSMRDKWVIGVAGVTVTLAKLVYWPLILLAVVPKPANISWRRWIAIPLVLGLIAALLMFAWMRFNAQSLVTGRSQLPTAAEQLSWIVAHPVGYCQTVIGTFALLIPTMWARLYAFGDSTIPIVGSAALAGFAAMAVSMIIGLNENVAIDARRRCWMMVIVGAVALLIATALFLGHTPLGARVVSGIQGRYFVPVLPIAMIAIARRGKPAPAILAPATLLLVLASNFITLDSIANAFYII